MNLNCFYLGKLSQNAEEIKELRPLVFDSSTVFKLCPHHVNKHKNTLRTIEFKVLDFLDLRSFFSFKEKCQVTQ